ncbi:MAG: hypothetical protein ACYDCL_08970 [Myxococcales bacterium]
MRLVPVALLAVLCAWPALAEEGVLTGDLGGGAAVTLSSGSATQGAVTLSARYGITDRLNVELPVYFEAGVGPQALLVGLGLEDVWWRNNHWQVSSGGGVATDYVFASGVPWLSGPYGQCGVRWLFLWGVGLSLDLRVLLPVGEGTVRPLGAALPSPWRAVILPSLSLYQELF